jgi:hypothetical protein
MFNASISGDIMRKKYIYNNVTKSWEGEGDLVEGDIISFKVKSLIIYLEIYVNSMDLLIMQELLLKTLERIQ